MTRFRDFSTETMLRLQDGVGLAEIVPARNEETPELHQKSVRKSPSDNHGEREQRPSREPGRCLQDLPAEALHQ